MLTTVSRIKSRGQLMVLLSFLGVCNKKTGGDMNILYFWYALYYTLRYMIKNQGRLYYQFFFNYKKFNTINLFL